jgi:hypothetical protein
MQKLSNSSYANDSNDATLRRNHLKHIFVILISMTLFFSMNFQQSHLIVQASQNNFNDMKTTDWFYENVTKLVSDSRGIVKGYPDGTFKPQASLRVDEFIVMLVRASGYKLENAQGYWAQNFIDKALALGYVKTGEFDNYKRTITREEMSRMIVRAIEALEGKKTYIQGEQIKSCTKDIGTGNTLMVSDILKTYELGIITGYPDFTFKPKGGLTRAEASTVLRRVIDPSVRVAFDYELVNAKLVVSEDVKLGYKAESFTGRNQIDFRVGINVQRNFDEQLILAREFLEKKVGKSLSDEILEYIVMSMNDSRRESWRDPLLEDVKVYDGTYEQWMKLSFEEKEATLSWYGSVIDMLELPTKGYLIAGKTFIWGNKSIKVVKAGSNIINISGW